MTTFRYKGVSAYGEKVSGIVRAYDEYEAVAQLKDTCPVITSIDAVSEQTTEKAIRMKKLKPKELSVLCSQFSIILGSGLPVDRCIELVANQTREEGLRAVLKKTAEDVAGGFGFAQSLEKNGPGFPSTFIETVRAGEQSGSLEKCFQRLQKYFEKTAKTSGKVKGMMTYPAIVLVVAVVVVVIIMVKAVPMFSRTFAELGTELPGVTKGLIAVSSFCTGYWWLLLLIGVLIYLGLFLARRNEKSRMALAKFSLTKGLLKSMNLMNASAEFASTMSTMLAAGLPIPEALRITSNVASNYAFGASVKAVGNRLVAGISLLTAMKEQGIFPEMLTEMCGVGERTGNLEDTLDVVSDYYNNEVEIITNRLLAMMEPAITIVLAVFTVILLMAVYLPMFSMYGSI